MIRAKNYEKLSKLSKLRPKYCRSLFSGHGVYNRLDRIPACDRQTDGHLGTASRYGYPSCGENRKSNTNAIHYKQNVTQENKHLDIIYV